MSITDSQNRAMLNVASEEARRNLSNSADAAGSATKHDKLRGLLVVFGDACMACGAWATTTDEEYKKRYVKMKALEKEILDLIK